MLIRGCENGYVLRISATCEVRVSPERRPHDGPCLRELTDFPIYKFKYAVYTVTVHNDNRGCLPSTLRYRAFFNMATLPVRGSLAAASLASRGP